MEWDSCPACLWWGKRPCGPYIKSVCAFSII